MRSGSSSPRNSDGELDPETYGQITVRVQRPTEPLSQGPNQAQDIMIAFAGDRRGPATSPWGEIAEITEGNLALPLADDSVLYVEPIYTSARTRTPPSRGCCA